MYCGHCGAELRPGDKMCPQCGYLVLDTQQSSEAQEVQSSVAASEIASAQEASLTEKPVEQKKKFHLATKFKLALVIALACFIFPFATVSCAGEVITASGYEIMTATSLADEDEIAFTDFQLVEVKTNAYLVIAFLMGAVGIALARKEKPLKVPCIFSTGGAICLILFRTNFYSYYHVNEMKELFALDFRWGWWASFVSFAVATLIALQSFINGVQQEQSICPTDQNNSKIASHESSKKSSAESIAKIIGYVIGVAIVIAIFYGVSKLNYNPEMPRATQEEVEDQEYFPDLQDPNGNFEAIVPEVSDYIGEWGDTISQRCFMTIEVLDDSTCFIQINWSSGASEDTQWNMTGNYNSSTGEIEYYDGTSFNYVYTDDGDVIEDLLYTDGTGKFYFSDGYLNWQDDVEQVGDRCLFEKTP